MPVVGQGAGDEAGVEQVQHRVLDAADILVDRQPVVGRRLVDRRLGASGSVKRAKYQELSTKVSRVSVSRSAGPPQCGQVVCFQVGWRASGVAGPAEVEVVGQAHRQLARAARRPGRRPAQWMTGIGQPQPRWRETPQSRRR